MMKWRYLVTAPLAAALAGLTGPAAAHVTAQPNEAPAGAYFQAAFTVPHGCRGSATVAVRIKIPNGVVAVKPQMRPGWDASVTMRKFEKPVDAGHGRVTTEAIDEVVWRGGPLPDDQYDSFGLVMKLPDAAGQTLYFPVVQECREGIQRWMEIPAGGKTWGDLSEPAPFIRLKRKTP